MASGWILLNRSIQDHWLWRDEPYDKARAFIDLLFLANYEDKKTYIDGDFVECKRGDVNLSIKYLAERWNWSRHKVSDFLNMLEKDNMITQVRTSKRTVITIVNYDVYQNVKADKDIKRTSVRTSKGHQKDTTKEIKEIKEYKENKNIYGEFKHVKLTDQEYNKLASDYGVAVRDEAIKFLDEYIEEKPKYKSASHNLAIRRWVVSAVDERKGKEVNGGAIVGNTEVYTENVKLW